MPDLTDLIVFIKDSEFWGSDAWEHGLTRAIPNWRMLVREPENWEEIEKVRPPKGREYSFLCWQLVQTGGLALAKRWWYSDVKDQKYTAERWCNNNLSMWNKFNQDMKNEILTDKFSRYPGEPFETILKYCQYDPILGQNIDSHSPCLMRLREPGIAIAGSIVLPQ